MKEFGFYNDFDDALMLNEQIEINNENGDYLVSNSPKLKANIIAPEINFYLKNTTASVLEKAKNTLLLYEARASAFDMAKDVDYEKEVGKNVVIKQLRPRRASKFTKRKWLQSDRAHAL